MQSVALLSGLLIRLSFPSAEAFPPFETLELDPKAGKVVYAVAVDDVNGDGRPDVCGLTESAVVWYENPTWERHSILEGATQELHNTQRDNVCFQPLDIDQDGDLDFVIGADWRPTDTENGGTLQWARQEDDGTWTLFPIGAEPTLHRIRWANVKGDERPELIAVPLQGRGTSPPDWGQGNGVRILVYSIPDQPDQASWPVEVADDSLHTTHNFWPYDWDDDGVEELIVAAWEGVFLLDRGQEGTWERRQLGTGDQESTSSKGSSEVKLGRLGGGGGYIATIEPWHGHQVVIYSYPSEGKGLWNRAVIDQPLTSGHALWTIDLDGDIEHELIVGHRNPNPDESNAPRGPGLFVYDPIPGTNPPEFQKHVIDNGGVAVEDAMAADLDADGDPELIAGGRATHNIRIYWNRTVEQAKRSPR